MVLVPMWLSAALLAPMLAVSAPDYPTLRAQAEPVSNLGRFLERVVGDCDHDDAAFDKKGCQEEAAKNLKRYESQTIMVEVDQPEEQLHFADWDQGRQSYRLHLTPFFGER